MKNVVLILILFFSSNTFFGQTLAQFGNHIITREEFLTAYRKNNSHVKATAKSYREYLNLYIRYRLKVQAANDLKLDTLPGQITELLNFKSQIVDQYMNDETSLNQMAKEAFYRSQHDLRLSYIYVASPRNSSPTDTTKAWGKIQQAYQALKKGENFGDVTMRFSEDPFVKNNQGDLGFITVFDLPYSIETVAYKTALGKYSTVFKTPGGYVILKKTAERPALGRIHAAQILIAFPFQANDAAKKETLQRADSIFRAIRNGSDFATLAKKFSGDNLSYQLGGSLPEFGIGKYEKGFEETAFNLKNDGDISEPYASSFGYHIIKRVTRIPVPSKLDQKTLNDLKEKIKKDPRIAISRDQMLQTILRKTKFNQNLLPDNRLWDYTDSLLKNKKPASNAGINDATVLFQFPEKKYTVGDWIIYRKSLRTSPNLTNGKTNSEILDGYRQAVVFEYYKQHLEQYNAAYASQVNEFRDGNLLFEIMQRQIWNRSSADSAGLEKYYETHKEKYWWKPGAEAVIFNALNLSSADKLSIDIKNNFHNWRMEVDSLASQVQADSGRFELNQIPGNGKTLAGSKITPYSFSTSQESKNKSVQFAYIIREYPSPSPRSFAEARSMAINDYQNDLENKWIEELKKKYPVSINENILKTLPK
ncbi:MAG TPA: peptidylprolyl isomerase [Puia sp.]|nr:peptidylprolyl isomerase [Puia sp.]